MLSITSLEWARSGYNVVFTGPSGTGKIWLACALGNHACRMGLSCFFIFVPALTETLIILIVKVRKKQFIASLVLTTGWLTPVFGT
jgi:DNA replication protein DnaC